MWQTPVFYFTITAIRTSRIKASAAAFLGLFWFNMQRKHVTQNALALEFWERPLVYT